MTTETALITSAGEAAAIAANGSGLELKITHVAIGAASYTPTRAMTALTDLREVAPVLVGAKQGSQVTLTATFRASLYTGLGYGVGEIGFFAGNPTAGGVLVAVISAPGRSAPARGGANITNYTPTFVLSFTGVPAGSVGVTFDPTAGAGLVALSAHVAAVDPHPQYLPKAGGTMSGPIVLAGPGTAPLHPVTRNQLDTALSAFGSVDAQTISVGTKIIKFGTTSSFPLDSTNNAVAFTTPFPNACDVVLLTASTNNGVGNPSSNYVAGIYDKTAAGFKVNNDSLASAFDWIAIGR
jgi:hypothetical protein